MPDKLLDYAIQNGIATVILLVVGAAFWFTWRAWTNERVSLIKAHEEERKSLVKSHEEERKAMLKEHAEERDKLVKDRNTESLARITDSRNDAEILRKHVQEIMVAVRDLTDVQDAREMTRELLGAINQVATVASIVAAHASQGPNVPGGTPMPITLTGRNKPYGGGSKT